MFILLFKGRNASGMLSHVLLPIITAFFPDMVSALYVPSFSDEAVSGTVVVTFAKYAISRGRRHGNRPDDPIPLFIVAATIKVTEGRWAIVFEKQINVVEFRFCRFPKKKTYIQALSLPKDNSTFTSLSFGPLAIPHRIYDTHASASCSHLLWQLSSPSRPSEYHPDPP